jgi:hypothetical protein
MMGVATGPGAGAGAGPRRSGVGQGGEVKPPAKTIKIGQYELGATLGVGSFGKVKREFEEVWGSGRSWGWVMRSVSSKRGD